MLLTYIIAGSRSLIHRPCRRIFTEAMLEINLSVSNLNAVHNSSKTVLIIFMASYM